MSRVGPKVLWGFGWGEVTEVRDFGGEVQKLNLVSKARGWRDWGHDCQ